MVPLVAALLAASVAAAPSPSGPPALAELVSRARAARLAEDPGWVRLGHWRRRPFGGWKSEADGPAFFLAPDGKTDPRAELEATLAALLEPDPRADEADEPQCRFPARLAFLEARLGLHAADLPPRSCPKLEDFRRQVAPVGATLVFSSYYLDNPASAFGHTFLRLDKGGGTRDEHGAELLDYGIDYSARVDGSTGLVYAVKGLLGGFRGQFNFLAFYYKVREYADAESRDLWEYDLALSPDEVALLAAHLWELGGTWFDYWYLDENCSYHVLAALEAAAPRLELLAQVGRNVVFPGETVKALFRTPGLVRAVRYRPSILTQFRARVATLSPRAAGAVSRLEADPGAPLPDGSGRERAEILDAALDLLDLRGGKDLVLGKAPAAALRRQVLLERRAELGIPSAPLEIATPEARRPDRGHGALRLGVGGGGTRDGGGTVLLDARPALHDLGDPPDGYSPLARLEFFPVRVRVTPAERRIELDDLALVRVLSLNPVTRFDLRPSWRLSAGATTIRDAGCDRCLAGAAELGGGLTAADLAGALDVAAFGDVELVASPRLAGAAGTAWRPGLGPSALARLRLGSAAALLAEARWRWLPDASPRETWRLALEARLHLGRALSLAVEAARAPREERVSALVYVFR